MMPCGDLPSSKHGHLQPASSRRGLLLGWRTLGRPLLPQTPTGATGRVGLLAKPTGIHSPRSPHPVHVHLPPCLRAQPRPTQAPHPAPLSSRSLLYHRGMPSRPAASPPRLSPPGAPQHPGSRGVGGLACPRPAAAQVSGQGARTGGGCTSPDPLRPIPSDRTSS